MEDIKQQLPNSTLILVLGIVSIVTCCCYGFVGLIFGVVALVLANKATKIYAAQPELYTGFQNVKTGKILAIIGIVLSVVYLLFVLWLVTVFGWEVLQDQELLRESLEEYQNMN